MHLVILSLNQKLRETSKWRNKYKVLDKILGDAPSTFEAVANQVHHALVQILRSEETFTLVEAQKVAP